MLKTPSGCFLLEHLFFGTCEHDEDQIKQNFKVQRKILTLLAPFEPQLRDLTLPHARSLLKSTCFDVFVHRVDDWKSAMQKRQVESTDSSSGVAAETVADDAVDASDE